MNRLLNSQKRKNKLNRGGHTRTKQIGNVTEFIYFLENDYNSLCLKQDIHWYAFFDEEEDIIEPESGNNMYYILISDYN